jgi:hypothetical protein
MASVSLAGPRWSHPLRRKSDDIHDRLYAAAQDVRKGATYRNAAKAHGLTAPYLHRYCQDTGLAPQRKPGRREGWCEQRTIIAANLVLRGFTYRAACTYSGASLSATHKRVKALRRKQQAELERGQG